MAFWIKICGITNYDDARAAVDAGANALGFNFFNKSRRFVDIPTAQQIVDRLPPSVIKVGVFVNHDASRIAEVVQEVGLDAVQLHGDEPPELITLIPAHVRVMRAHRCGPEGLTPLVRFLEDCHSLGRLPDALLIDADVGANFGGSGQLADWPLIRKQRDMTMNLPLILAGGLTPDNVAAAIEAVAPNGVDVASGVEREPGLKDPALITRFVTAARQASAHL